VSKIFVGEFAALKEPNMARDHEEGVTRPSNDAYTGMLSLSLLALIGSCLLLYMDYSQYPDTNPPAPPKASLDKVSQNPIATPKDQKSDFVLRPAEINLNLGKDFTVDAKFGKVDSVDIEPKDPGMTYDFTDATVKIMAAADAKEQIYSVTAKTKEGKSATLKVNVTK
jgi:hypothetical protein